MGVSESRKKFREVLKYFCADLTASQIAHLTHLNINTINKILHLLRQRMFELPQLQSSSLVRQLEVDESYFGVRCVRGKRGRGASEKVIVCGLLKRGDKIPYSTNKKVRQDNAICDDKRENQS